jgi:predicted dehydrogenase
VKVGVVGCGDISGIYMKAGQTFEILKIVACADLLTDKARSRAAEFKIPRVCTTKELLADPQIEIVVNLTTPPDHFGVDMQAIKAGKSVHSEKPLGITREEGRQVTEAARAAGVRVGCAPDTFLGAGGQTCRKLIDEGAIGEPVAATAFVAFHGPEGWHPNPDFYYKKGGGPMFDMGPYYLTALVNLLGPVRRVTGSTRITFPQRTATSRALYGHVIDVEVPTHVVGILDFECGAIATILTSFDIWAANLPRIEVYGSEGSLSVPDPNTFGGPVRLWRSREEGWKDMPLTHGYAENSRGIGPADMAYALRSGRPHRASGEMAYHVLDIMQAFHEASDLGKHVELSSTCQRPAALPLGLEPGKLDP